MLKRMPITVPTGEGMSYRETEAQALKEANDVCSLKQQPGLSRSAWSNGAEVATGKKKRQAQGGRVTSYRRGEG